MLRVPFVALCAMFLGVTTARSFEPNYDEAKIPQYQLPDPLSSSDGASITSSQQWESVGRPATLKLFQDHVYGVSPDPVQQNVTVQGKVVSRKDDALGGRAIRREIDVTVTHNNASLTMQMLVYTPASSQGPVPTFLGLNFQGNHSVDPDPAIRIPDSWMRNRNNGTTDGNRATEAGRGVAADRWPIETIVGRGYGLATIYYGDIDPDQDDGFQNGIHGLFADWNASADPQTRWGSIAGWAFGLSRALDFLETDAQVDARNVIVIGHSRLGKTALWAGATDPRFAMVISNDSGCGGAALSRRAFGETVGRINQSFPHWFNDRFQDYNENESALPVDQHQLLALIAPRPLCVASATEDRWADPHGEFLSCVHASPVYRLYGVSGIGLASDSVDMPSPEQPLQYGHISYHLRIGKHDLAEYDWLRYLDFADKHLMKR
ncbi:glucuronyl esterase domain-containing protein [Crateriforma conspicua]|uniref:glucuronyl esterase domain-containing protein n=1 Tax=Crateriforma conspicua TaxID=2527996 RepID=UPI0011893917|nr:acetylxylan esterase [Crateriforma conspicua]QDV60974.1 hypothetical protein Mal65_00950 [Crateriforma conspicua]